MSQVKKYIWILCLLLLANQLYCPIIAAESTALNLYVDNIKIDARPINKNGVIYAPIYTLATALKANIEWNAKLNIIKINGNLVSSPPYLNSGEVMLPVDAIAQAIGGTLTVEGQSNTIKIFTKSTASIPVSSAPETASAYEPNYQQAPDTSYTPGLMPSNSPKSGFPTALMNSSMGSTTYPSQNPSSTITPPYAEQPLSSGSYPPSAPLTPTHAPPQMPENLNLPPAMPEEAYRAKEGPFIPKTTRNSVFSVTVTNVEEMDIIKGYYKPKNNNKFVIVYLSQTNTANEVQIYTGKFAMVDGLNNAYDYIEGLSNFWLVILKPGGTNFGYLVFEIPRSAKPMNLMLHALNQKPLSINLY